MRYGKALLNIILLVALIFLVVIITSTQTQETVEFLQGYVKMEEVDVTKKYMDTMLGNYDPERDWHPSEENNTSSQPNIIGTAGVLVDIDSGDILYEKEANIERPIASLTKIMTAVVALEHKDINDKIYVTKNSAEIGENSMGITYGEVYTLEELLYGLVLHSGNDSAYAIAEGLMKKIPDFGLAYFLMGTIDIQRGNMPEGESFLLKSIQLELTNRDKAWAFHNLGIAALRQQNIGKAIDYLKKAIEINPDMEESKKTLSSIEKQMGND